MLNHHRLAREAAQVIDRASQHEWRETRLRCWDLD